MHRVHLLPYDFRWTEEFARESSAISRALGRVLIAIHHIGSTAIPGIHAKPIIDMLAVTSDIALLDESASRLQALGYDALGEFGIPGRRYFRKNNPAEVRTHHIHVFEAGSPQIARHLAFRDFLQAHPDDARRYDALKRRLAELYPRGTADYTQGKESFIHDIDARAACCGDGDQPGDGEGEQAGSLYFFAPSQQPEDQ